MRQHASLYPHDSNAGPTPAGTRFHLAPTGVTHRRRRLVSAFLAVATGGTLATLSAAAASTPRLNAPPDVRRSPAATRATDPGTSRSTGIGRGSLGRRSGTLASLLAPDGAGGRRHDPKERSRAARHGGDGLVDRSWRTSALDLSLRLLDAPAPRPSNASRATLRDHLHRGAVLPYSPADGVSDSTWAALRECESGDDYAADTGNGYYGAYQFSLTTWWSIGYPGLPSEASSAVQDAAARRLLATQGWGAWPVCSARLGL